MFAFHPPVWHYSDKNNQIDFMIEIFYDHEQNHYYPIYCKLYPNIIHLNLFQDDIRT